MKRTLSLRATLILSLSLVLGISVTLLGSFLYRNTFREIITNAEEISSSVTAAHAQTLNQYLSSIEDLTFTIQNNTIVQNALSTSESTTTLEQIQTNDALSTFLQKLSYSYDGILGILIFTDEEKSTYNYANPFGFYEQTLLAPGPLRQELLQDHESGYVPTFSNNIIRNSSIKNVFCYYEKLYNHGIYCGTLCILIDCNVFDKVLSSTRSEYEKFILLFGETAVYPNDFPVTELFADCSDLSSTSHLNYNRNSYLAVPVTLSNGWKLIDLIPTFDIRQSANHILQQVILVLCVTTFFYLICMVLISHYVTKNLALLCQKMTSPATWRQKLPSTFYITEISTLNTQFNKMLDQLDSMLEEVKKEQHRLDKMEIDLLQARINPHFLYNTLDAINWMAIDRGADDISEMTSDLAAMFRYGLNHGSDITTLANEMTHLEKYLNIQRYRFSNRFHFYAEVDHSLYTQPFLNIILQPFVENSLLHGLRSAKDTIDIHLTIKLTDGVFHIWICDNGAGCDAALLNDYLASAQKSTKGYGIKNIHQRIQLHFGDGYGVCYHETTVGTQVEVTMPTIKQSSEEDTNV